MLVYFSQFLPCVVVFVTEWVKSTNCAIFMFFIDNSVAQPSPLDFGQKLSYSLATAQPQIMTFSSKTANFLKSVKILKSNFKLFFRNVVSNSRLRWKIEFPIKERVYYSDVRKVDIVHCYF